MSSPSRNMLNHDQCIFVSVFAVKLWQTRIVICIVRTLKGKIYILLGVNSFHVVVCRIWLRIRSLRGVCESTSQADFVKSVPCPERIAPPLPLVLFFTSNKKLTSLPFVRSMELLSSRYRGNLSLRKCQLTPLLLPLPKVGGTLTSRQRAIDR